MSDKTERPGAREGRRGLQSVVQLYLSRPPRREHAWPEPETETPPPLEESARRRFVTASAVPVERGVEPPIEQAPSELEIERDRQEPIEPARPETIDAAARAILERLDARIEAVSAIPFVDVDGDEVEGRGEGDANDLPPVLADTEDVEVARDIMEPAEPDERRAGTPVVDEATAKEFEDEVTVELIEDEETDDVFEGAPEPVLSGISLDIEERLEDTLEPGAYDALSGIAPEAEDDDDVFSEDALPPQEIGSEALRAELAFKLEEHLDPSREATLETPRDEPPPATPRGESPLATARAETPLETEILFEEDRPTTEMVPEVTQGTAVEEIFDLVDRMKEVPVEVAQGTSVEEILDLVDRTLALGHDTGIIESPSAHAAQALQEVGWEMLPEVEPESAAPRDAPEAGPMQRGASIDAPSMTQAEASIDPHPSTLADAPLSGAEDASAAEDVVAEIAAEEVVAEEIVDEQVVDEQVVDEEIVDEQVVDEQVVAEEVVAEEVVAKEVVDEQVVAKEFVAEDIVVEDVADLETTLPLTDVAGPVLAPDAALETTRVALFLSTLPPHLRRRVLDTLGAPIVASGRRVLFLEPDPAGDVADGLIEEALGLETAVWRRSLGASPREILLMRPAQREQLFAGLAAEERRSQLVLLGVGLPESIFCPRMIPLVDTIVVGLTRQESSLYEAYRALRGLPERRHDLTPYAVTIASSAEEAALLLQRFRQIARDFLRSPVLDGGWLELAALPQGSPDAGAAASDEPRDGLRPGLDPTLLELLGSPRGAEGDPAGSARGFDGRPDRAFFERLADWFGPLARP